MVILVIEIIFLILFIIFFIIGFYIIYKQVALVKKGEFRNRDLFQCVNYGIIFSLAVMVVIGVALIFAVETVNSLILFIPFVFCLIYISFYPLLDFLFIALSKESDEGLTPFHKFISLKLINKFKKTSIKILTAIVFYVFVFFLPPFLLAIIGLPFIVIWVTWALFYPLMILTFYGSKGYIAGISNAYYHIPNIKRSIFINFEDPKRGIKQFLSDPGSYIILGLMLFVFVWAWISLFQTIAFFFTGRLAISIMSTYFVFVTLIFGIMGYFTRFWGRKIKYRGIDIYFAAYLMASIGINVLVNFLIVNPKKLKSTFGVWNITSQIVPNVLKFALAAAIEEIVLIIFISYFLLARSNNFVKNIQYSKITECGQTFDPIPLFNLIKNKNHQIKNHAEETLILMFERIPFKSDIDINSWQFKNSLMDGICENDPNSRRICIKILTQLEKDVPFLILPWIIENLRSPNYDKSYPVVRTLLKADIKFVEKIPRELIFNLVEDPEWRLKILGLKLISRLIFLDNEFLSNLNLNNLINNPDSRIQVEILNLLSDYSLKIPVEIIIDKIFNSNNEISAAAIKNLKNLNIKEIDRKTISRLIPLMKNPSSLVRASIFNIFVKIGKFKKNNIPILPFLDGITDPNEFTRKAAINVLEKYFEEDKDLLDIDTIIKKIDPNKLHLTNSVISLLGRLWNYSPEKILATLLTFIKFDNEQLQENISNILAENYKNNPDLIVQKLIEIPDVSKFVTKGIISQTLIKIGKLDPKTIIHKLLRFLDDVNDDVRINSIITISGLVEEYIEYLDIKPVLLLLKNDKNKQVKKKASLVISEAAKKDPRVIEPIIDEFFNIFNELELSVKIVLSKSILEIARNSPELIPVPNVLALLSDQDSFIRETSVKILGHIGYKLAGIVVDTLINKALIDKEWIVREAAASSLGRIVSHVENKEIIIEKLVSLMDDKQKWVRRSAVNILSNMSEVNSSHVPFEKLKKCIRSGDPNVREASARLIKIFSNQIEEILDIILLLLGDEVKEVRISSINSFVEIVQKMGLDRILSKLLQNLSDEGSLETQRSIALIFGRTVKYEDDSIKKRVISLLKIRCEMSQDPIICATLQKLKEN